MAETLTFPCSCNGRTPSCAFCRGTGQRTVVACRRCHGTGKEGEDKCVDCRGLKFREIDQSTFQ